MERWHEVVKKQWEIEPKDKGPSRLDVFLRFASSLYGLGVKLRLFSSLYLKKRSLPGFVVSVGNLTVGGTGKTPATRMLAEWASREGHRVAVLSRGYGRRYENKTLEVSDVNGILTGPEEAGDEPYLLANNLPGVPVILSKKRYKAGRLAHSKYDTDIFILDDGFQHVSLERDLDLVLLDASNPFGNEQLLPGGPLREPVDHLDRADAFMLTRSREQSSTEKSIALLKDKFPDKPVFQSEHIPDSVIIPNKNEIHPPGFLEGKRVVAFAGIAAPDRFRETIIDLGAEPVFFKAFGDHHSFRTVDLLKLMSQKESLKADCLLTTEKDWVRIEGPLTEYPDLSYLTIRLVLKSDENRFFQLIKEKLRSS
jgi:tetraacyldisaccharide 4'-kinase